MPIAAAPVPVRVDEEARRKDYSLIGRDTSLAIERGLAEADWYMSPVPKAVMRELLERRDGPALRDTCLYFALIAASGYATWHLWGSWWAVVPMMAYGVLYASASDARWHEAGHGTAFRTDWMNNALYEVASFMVLRESVPWRWSHTRHHSDTIIVGRDPEIAVPRPPDLREMFLKCFNYRAWRRYLTNIAIHCTGRVTDIEATFIPPAEYGAVYLRARIYATILLGMIAACVYLRTWLPFIFVLGPNVYGAWLMAVYGWTQHTALAENVLDHRLNCRTILMNPVHRFLYWNMNYHTEHHMFPLVPYHQLPRLHAIVKDDCPAPYRSLTAAYREMVPAILRQRRDPGWYIRRTLPPTARPVGTKPTAAAIVTDADAVVDGWVDVCASAALAVEDVIRVDHAHHTYAIHRTAQGAVHATDGMCTHGNTHLADGLVRGSVVECPKHNGRFDVVTGEPRRLPACVALGTHRVREGGGRILLDVSRVASGRSASPVYELRVVSNRNVATFIKELVLAPAHPRGLGGDGEPGAGNKQPESPGRVDRSSDVVDRAQVEGHMPKARVDGTLPSYRPGQYMQLHIPAYGALRFEDIVVDEPYASVWRAHHLFDLGADNDLEMKRNYSLASNPASAPQELRFNVRIATPPTGQACAAGAGSSWVWRLQPGDTVRASGPFGSFLVPDGTSELVYVGGGAGMAPIRSHISYLFETVRTTRRVSYWYGARSRQEAFYADYFRGIEARFPNFRFHLALSAPLDGDAWDGPTGLIHDVVRRDHLAGHAAPAAAAYFVCGPPVMVDATRQMLQHEFGVPADAIIADQF
jgi:Na+-transporting NADH:ubiquinone oxidoreductase subunit F